MRLTILIGVLAGLVGCRAAVPTPTAQPESVGSLTHSYGSVASAPLKHDAPPELGQVVDTDTDVPITVGGQPSTVETPEKVDKVSHGF